MAAKRNNSRVFWKLLIVIFGLAGGAILLAFVTKSLQTPNKTETNASEETVALQSWEFNGVTTENWVQDPKNTKISMLTKDGILHYMFGLNVNQGGIYRNISYSMPVGLKKFALNVRVMPVVPSCPATVLNSAPCTVAPTPIPYPITIEVHYQKKTMKNGSIVYQDLKGSPLKTSGTADGLFHIYELPFTDTLSLFTTDRITVNIPEEVARHTCVDIDWIRLLYVKFPSATLSPVNPSTPITVTGTLIHENLEGTSGYKVVMPNGVIYWLKLMFDESNKSINISQMIGQQVTVNGYLQSNTQPGIPTTGNFIQVTAITAVGVTPMPTSSVGSQQCTRICPASTPNCTTPTIICTPGSGSGGTMVAPSQTGVVFPLR